MKKIIIPIMICFALVSDLVIVADASERIFSLTLTMGSPAYIQVPRNGNNTYIEINIDSIRSNSPIYVSMVDSSHTNISNSIAINNTGSYYLSPIRPIAPAEEIYIRFSCGYYPVYITGSVVC